MRRYRVVVAPEARQQIAAQVEYIERRSPRNAVAWESRLLKEIDSLGDAPGRAVDEDASEDVGREIRKTSFEGTYILRYEVDHTLGAVFVLSFTHGARRRRRGQI